MDTNQFIWSPADLSECLGIPIKVPIRDITINSKLPQKEAMFIGLKGKNVNGGIFALEAIQNGATIAVVDSEAAEILQSTISSNPSHFMGEININATLLTNNNDTLCVSIFATIGKDIILVVNNTINFLRELAQYKRARFHNPVIGVTGSVGKTTTKEMLATAIPDSYSSFGNYNNAIGLPLCLAKLPLDSSCAIFEVGISHKGEMDPLAALIKPDIAVITNISVCHIAHLSTVENIAKEKSNIFNYFSHKCWAILNCETDFFALLLENASRYTKNILTFGRNKGDIKLLNTTIQGDKIVAHIQYFDQNLECYTFHISSLNSIVISLAIGYILKLPIQPMIDRINKFQSPKGRGQITNTPAITIIDESYNASPISMKNAMLNLCHYKSRTNSRTIAILGDMLELGDCTDTFHYDVINYLNSLNIDKVYTVGPNMNKVFPNIINDKKGQSFKDAEECITKITAELKENDIVMIKGSFFMNLGTIVDYLKNMNIS